MRNCVWSGRPFLLCGGKGAVNTAVSRPLRAETLSTYMGVMA
jgi:hypothetical protein